MLILLAVGLAVEVSAFLLLFAPELAIATVGATVGGAVGIIGTGLVLAVRSAYLGEKSETNKSIEPPSETQKASDELGVLN